MSSFLFSVVPAAPTSHTDRPWFRRPHAQYYESNDLDALENEEDYYAAYLTAKREATAPPPIGTNRYQRQRHEVEEYIPSDEEEELEEEAEDEQEQEEEEELQEELMMEESASYLSPGMSSRLSYGQPGSASNYSFSTTDAAAAAAAAAMANESLSIGMSRIDMAPSPHHSHSMMGDSRHLVRSLYPDDDVAMSPANTDDNITMTSRFDDAVSSSTSAAGGHRYTPPPPLLPPPQQGRSHSGMERRRSRRRPQQEQQHLLETPDGSSPRIGVGAAVGQNLSEMMLGTDSE